MLLEIPRFHRRARAVLASDAGAAPRTGRGRPDAARLPRRGTLLGRLRPPLHGAAGRGRLVVRPGHVARLPRALPLHLPRAPRHARRLRLAGVAHRHGRVRDLRRRGRRRHPRRAPRDQGDVGARARPRGRGHRRQRRHHDLRRGRHRDPPRARARHAGVAQRPPARGPLGPALQQQPRAAAHRLLAPARGPRRPRVVELPPPGERDRAGHGDLRPHPAPAPAHRHPLPRHPRRRGPGRPGDRDRPDGVRAPALHPRVGGRLAPAARHQHRADRLRRRLPRLGLPRGRRALGAGRGHPPRPAVDPHDPRGPAGRALHDHDPAHPAYALHPHLRAHLDDAGWSTSTSCPTTASWPASRPATTWAPPIAHCATTSRRSSPTTASRSATASVPARS